MNHADCVYSTGKECRAGSLSAILLSLALGTLGTFLLVSILTSVAVASAARDENPPHKMMSAVLDYVAASPPTTTVQVTKTVDPPHPDTGGIVTICFTISGLEPQRVDVVLAQDVSLSMNDPAGDGVTPTRLEASQAAACAFVSSLPSTDRSAVVSYSTTANLAQPLTVTKTSVTNIINDLTAAGYTNIGEGISVSHRELITSPRYLSDTAKVIILLSDGKANRPVDETKAKAYAQERAGVAARDNIIIYTVGFGNDADEALLQEIAHVSGGRYFFAPDGDALKTIYLTIALELHNLVITDILPPGVETDCYQWPNGCCIRGPDGVTTITFPISDTLLISESAQVCFTATVNLDPEYEGPINLPGSGICYQSADGGTECEESDNPPVAVGGRKIVGNAFYDLDGNGLRGEHEEGAPDVIVRTSTGITATTSAAGRCVFRTSEEPTMSVAGEIPLGYVATTPVSRDIPAATGVYTVDLGMRMQFHLPLVARNLYPASVIVNGGFEDGWRGWRHGGELPHTIESGNPYSGSFSALLGSPALECKDGVPVGSAWVEQTFFVPPTSHPRLSFSYNIFTEDKNPNLEDTFDSFDVKVGDGVVFRDAKRSGKYGCDEDVIRDLEWRTGQIDLSAHREGFITVRFENRSSPDGWFNTWTFVDDVQFMP